MEQGSRQAVRILQRRPRSDQRPSPLLALLLLGAVLAGCGSKGAVSLSGRIDAPSLEVASSVLVTSVEGRFDLVLELGDAAPRSTTVELGSFALRQGDAVLAEPLELSASERFPLEIAPSGSRSVEFTFSQELADTGARDAICAGQVWFSGNVIDSLSEGRATPVSSGEFAPVCP